MTEALFDATRVLADRAAMSTLIALAARLRAASYQNALIEGDRIASELALGYPVARQDMERSVLDVLVKAGAGDVDGDRFTPRFTLFSLGHVITLVPKDDGDDPGRVYFGRDSLWLADFVSRATSVGGAAADLGTGAGTVAALLAPRFDPVVGTEILKRTAASAAITFALNPRRDGTSAATACVTDVAGGLAAGAFALVTGNPPWVPELDHDITGPLRVFAEGGVTGFELPRRFIMEGAALLAPDGVMVMLTLDVTWADGARPLRALARGLTRLGLEVSLVRTDLSELWDTLERDLCDRFPDIRSVVHVAFVAHRPLGHMLPGFASDQAVVSSSRTNVNSEPNTRWVSSSV